MVDPGGIAGTGALVGDLVLRRSTAVLHADLEVAVGLEVALRPLLFQDDLPGGPEYLEVHYHHDGQGYVEAAQRSVQLIVEVLTHDTALDHDSLVVYGLVHPVLVAQDEERRQRDARGTAPHHYYAHDHAAGCPFHTVLEGLRDRVVPGREGERF